MDKALQRIAIAESRGARYVMCYGNASILTFNLTSDDDFADKAKGKVSIDETVPDYLNDLSCIVNVVVQLKGKALERYRDELRQITGGLTGCLTANAAQCCEAYLKAIGKWED